MKSINVWPDIYMNQTVMALRLSHGNTCIFHSTWTPRTPPHLRIPPHPYPGTHPHPGTPSWTGTSPTPVDTSINWDTPHPGYPHTLAVDIPQPPMITRCIISECWWRETAGTPPPSQGLCNFTLCDRCDLTDDNSGPNASLKWPCRAVLVRASKVPNIPCLFRGFSEPFCQPGSLVVRAHWWHKVLSREVGGSTHLLHQGHIKSYQGQTVPKSDRTKAKS